MSHELPLKITHIYKLNITHKGSRNNNVQRKQENRISDCGDNGKQHDLVVRRSEDDGKTWGPMILVRKGTVPCPGCPAAISNPNPLEVTFPNGTKAILLNFDTMNNPSPSAHGLDMQIWSFDDGKTWIQESVLNFQNTTVNTGALIGPSVGIQNSEGTIYFSMVFGKSHWLYVIYHSITSATSFSTIKNTRTQVLVTRLRKNVHGVDTCIRYGRM